MKTTALLLLFCGASACASTPPPAPAQTGVAASQPSDNPNRALTKGECESLGRVLADACANRPNERSARVDGWCSDVIRTVEDGTWVPHECLKSIKYMDSVCFESAANVHSMMACDESVAPSQ
jgi:hypothetical protein